MQDTYLLCGANASDKRPVTFSAFPDNDIHCVLERPDGLAGGRVLVVHRLYPDQNAQLVKLLLLLDLLQDVGAVEVSVFVPYMPYSRQDRRHASGEAVGADTLCALLARAGCKTLYTFDCHFMKGAPQTDRKGLHIVNVSLGHELVDYCRQQIGHDDFEVIGPDLGAAYLTQEFGAHYMHKRREANEQLDGGSRYRAVAEINGDHLQLGHKTAVIIDDMISTGSTLLYAIEQLHAQGVETVYCVATHGLFVWDSRDKLQARTAGVFCSDSVPYLGALPLTDHVLQARIVPAWLTA